MGYRAQKCNCSDRQRNVGCTSDRAMWSHVAEFERDGHRATQQGKRNMTSLRIGQGYDVHEFGPGDKVMLGGVAVPHTQGVRAHSDGDVLLHAVCDALLGAAALGDIGMHFSDTDPKWRGADSRGFVRHVYALLQERGFRVVNVDATVLAEAPRLGKYRAEMCANIATDLQLDHDLVNVKATTSEGMGFVGRREGLACHAIVLIEKT